MDVLIQIPNVRLITFNGSLMQLYFTINHHQILQTLLNIGLVGRKPLLLLSDVTLYLTALLLQALDFCCRIRRSLRTTRRLLRTGTLLLRCLSLRSLSRRLTCRRRPLLNSRRLPRRRLPLLSTRRKGQQKQK